MIREKMLEVYKIKNDRTGTYLNVIIIKYSDYYKVFVKNKDGNLVMSFKFDTVDTLIKAFIKNTINYSGLLEDMESIIDELNMK